MAAKAERASVGLEQQEQGQFAEPTGGSVARAGGGGHPPHIPAFFGALGMETMMPRAGTVDGLGPGRTMLQKVLAARDQSTHDVVKGTYSEAHTLSLDRDPQPGYIIAKPGFRAGTPHRKNRAICFPSQGRERRQ